MTGAEHYREAERLVANAEYHNTEDPRDMRIAEVSAYTAQVHATLALAASVEEAVRALTAEVPGSPRLPGMPDLRATKIGDRP